MSGVDESKRSACFRCVIALVDPDGRETTVEGRVDGTILDTPRGKGGFGYDPVFFIPEMGKTFAEMTIEEKRQISHRGRALDAARAVLLDWYDLGSAV